MTESGRDVKELLKEHAAAIKALEDALGGMPEEMDELWLLRYVLSFGATDVAKAAAAVRKAIEFRKNNAEWLRAARDENALPPRDAEVKEYIKVGRHKRATDGSVVFIVRSGVSRPSDALSAYSHDLLLKHQVFMAEQNYRLCDKYTRESGKLIKLISINDMTGIGFTTGHSDRRFMKIIGENSHTSEFCHPQLLKAMVVYNPPKIFQMLYSIGKLFISQKTFDKMAVCPGAGSMKKLKSVKDCPAASALFDPADLPTFLGGECTCASRGLNGCIANISNDRSTQFPLPADHAARVKAAK